MYKTGIFGWFGYIMPIKERLECIKKANFDNVMLWWEDETIPYFVDKKDFVKMAHDVGLEVDNIHLPIDESNLLWSPDTQTREGIVKNVLEWLDGCKTSGCDKVVFHTNNLGPETMDFSCGYKSFSSIIKAAEDIGINLAIENTVNFEYTEFILKEFESDRLWFCYDSSHDNIKGQSKGLILDKWKDRLLCVHLSDNDENYDRHWIPQKGTVDFKSIISKIKKTPCENFSLEVYPYLEEKELKPIDFLEKANNAITQLII